MQGRGPRRPSRHSARRSPKPTRELNRKTATIKTVAGLAFVALGFWLMTLQGDSGSFRYSSRYGYQIAGFIALLIGLMNVRPGLIWLARQALAGLRRRTPN